MAKLNGPTDLTLEGHISSGLLSPCSGGREKEAAVRVLLDLANLILGQQQGGSDLLRRTLFLSIFFQSLEDLD